jgi:peptide-methionine (S)-S-oxide reductase
MNNAPVRLARRQMSSALAALTAVGVLGFAGLQLQTSGAAEAAVKIPPLAGVAVAGPVAAQETAVFAGGCFWGVQGVFQHTKGVLNAVSGYSGGSKATASYQLIGSGLTGHAEAVQVTFDPNQVSYAQLLQIFFSVIHDPTQLNRQGPDRGTQYRSAIFTTDATQKQTVDRYIAQLDAAKVFPAKIVTQVTPLVAFYAAEDYHQDYATLHPESGYIATFDLPKIANLKTMFAAQYRDKPVLVAKRSQ